MANKIVDRGHGAEGEPRTGDSTPPDETPPVPEPQPTGKHRAAPVTSLFGKRDKTPKPSGPVPLPKAKPAVQLAKVDNSEGLAMLYSKAGDLIEQRGIASNRGGGSVGRAMRFTAPTAGRLLAEGVKRFPGLHNLLGVLIGTGATARDASAVISIPIQMHRMEGAFVRGEFGTVLEQMRLVKVQMRPILLDMVRALREEKKMMEELRKLEADLGDLEGRPFDLSRVILCDMLGVPDEMATDMLSGLDNADIMGKWSHLFAPAPQPEPEVESVA